VLLLLLLLLASALLALWLYCLGAELLDGLPVVLHFLGQIVDVALVPLLHAPGALPFSLEFCLDLADFGLQSLLVGNSPAVGSVEVGVLGLQGAVLELQVGMRFL
jgi:hypothetical protein